MGMFDSVANPLDTLSKVLAGGTAGTDAAVPDADAKFLRGYNLDVDESKKESAGQAPNLENALNSYPVIEFIHFGFVHTSHSNFFPHADYSDITKNDAVNDGDRPRGIQFRSALEREAVLLWQFMKSTETVLKQREADSAMGGVGAALNTAGSLLGASGGGSGKTPSSTLTGHEQKVNAAVQPILADSIVFKPIHQAGIDLQQARANYRNLLQTIISENPAAGSGGLIGQLPGLSGVPGPLGNIVSFTQGVAFKAQDVKAKFYALVAQQQEPQIEAACNEMTIQGINSLINPFLPVWASAPAKADQWAGPDDPLSGLQGNMFAPVRKAVQSPVEKARNAVTNEGNAIKGFFEHAPDTPPLGTEALGMAFNDPPTHLGDKSIVPMAMGDVACRAFLLALDKKPPLGFPETVVSGIVAVVLEFTKAVYQSLLIRDPQSPIDADQLFQSASEDFQFAKKLETLALEKLTFLQTIKDFDTSNVAAPMGFSVRPGDLADKGVGKLDDLIADKIRPLLTPILRYAMGDLAQTLEAGRKVGVAGNCHTMEWYLGNLPMVQAQLFSNLFFPFWNAMMRAGADLIGGPAGSALKTILGAADKMKGAVDTARNDLAKADALTTAASDTMGDFSEFDPNNVGDKVTRAGSRFDQAGKTTASANNSPQTNRTLASYPLAGRSGKGQGQAISLDDYNAIFPDFKWNGATDPAATNAKKDDASGSATVADGSAAASNPPNASGR